MNLFGAAGAVLSICTFALTYRWLRARSVRVRWVVLGTFGVLSVPAIWFAVYYLHVLPERAWFYTLRSWTGSEFLVLFLGVASGALAALLPRALLMLPLFGLVGVAFVPYAKPLVGPLPDEAFSEYWRGDVCLQSTPSTCGPASVANILKRLGVTTSERETARAAYSYLGGTEGWYLARYVRRKGLSARFVFQRGFHPEAGLPAMVGVRIGSAGHFIAVLEQSSDQIRYVDPLFGERQLSLADFLSRYQFTGFHMAVTRS